MRFHFICSVFLVSCLVFGEGGRNVETSIINVSNAATAPSNAETFGPQNFHCRIALQLQNTDPNVTLTASATLNFIYMKFGFTVGANPTYVPNWTGGAVIPSLTRLNVPVDANIIWANDTKQQMPASGLNTGDFSIKPKDWTEKIWTVGCNAGKNFSGSCSIPFVEKNTLLGSPWVGGVGGTVNCDLNDAVCTMSGELSHSVKVHVAGNVGSVVGNVTTTCYVDRGNGPPVVVSTPLAGGHAF